MSALIIGSCKGIGYELVKLFCEQLNIKILIITSRD